MFSDRCNYNNEHSYKIHNHLSALLYTRFSFNKYQQYLYAFCDTLKIFLRIKPYIYEIQPENSENLISSPFEPGNPTKVIIHGYLSSCDDDVFNVIKEGWYFF